MWLLPLQFGGVADYVIGLGQLSRYLRWKPDGAWMQLEAKSRHLNASNAVRTSRKSSCALMSPSSSVWGALTDKIVGGQGTDTT